LELDELEVDKRLNLDVSVTDASGAVIAEGATNEFLRITEVLADGDSVLVEEIADETVGEAIDEAIVEEVLENESPLVENDPVGDAISDQAAEVLTDITEVDEVPVSELVAEDVTEIVNVVADEVAELDDVSEIAAVVDEAAAGLTENADEVVEVISEVEGVSASRW